MEMKLNLTIGPLIGVLQSPEVRKWEIGLTVTSQFGGGRMNRASASRSGKSWNRNFVDVNLDPVGSNCGQVKPMLLKLILVTS